MRRRRSVAEKNELLMRSAEICQSASMSTCMLGRREAQSLESKVLPGWNLAELLTNQSVTFTQCYSAYPTDKTAPGPALPVSVGAIIQIRPYVSVVIGFPTAEFDRIWSLALPGQLRYARLVFTKPHYNKALVVSTSFSTDPDE